ncbi:PGG domain [Sesbania bispinosa]|nr:PGG domain [Sesbania bispinosa]
MAFAESRLLTSYNDVKDRVTDFARGFNYSYYQPLHEAILKGDWESTKAFLDNDPSALTAKVTALGRTALHVAAVRGKWQLVEKLVQHMPAHVLAEKDFMGCTCLHYVAMGDNIKAAKALVAKKPSLTQLDDYKRFTPLIYSIISSRCKKMVWYLVLNTSDEGPGFPFSGPSAGQLVALLTAAGFHDITMYLLQRYPKLGTISDLKGSIILNVLSKLPSNFQSGNVPAKPDYLPPIELRGDLKDSYGESSHDQSSFEDRIWNAIQCVEKETTSFAVPKVKRVRDAKLKHESAKSLVYFVCFQASTMNDSESQFWQSFVSKYIILSATSSGIVEILRICFQFFPELVWTDIPNEGYVVQIAINNRQEQVFSFLRDEMPTICKYLAVALDEPSNSTSHLAARFASPQLASISGAAFQMQRELQWFKEAEKLDHPLDKEVKNKDGKTAWQLFKEEHKALLEDGKKWMKNTSNSCMLVATLIATVAFAAAITVPGDALALFSSMASLLMFLSILTAHYAEEDFLKALPEKLILGLVSLFIAIVTTMIAFGTALSLILEDEAKWAPIPIVLLACVPIALFAKLQLPLLMQMIISTYGSPIYHHQSKSLLIFQNLKNKTKHGKQKP